MLVPHDSPTARNRSLEAVVYNTTGHRIAANIALRNPALLDHVLAITEATSVGQILSMTGPLALPAEQSLVIRRSDGDQYAQWDLF